MNFNIKLGRLRITISILWLKFNHSKKWDDYVKEDHHNQIKEQWEHL